jgi:predicted RND superfamily exporter protein
MEELETYKKLRDMEKKMQENENYIFSLLGFIESKNQENSYSHLAKECMELQQEINTELVKRMK